MLALVVCVSYALGCFAPGWLLVRRRTGADLRDTGSGGTGATNAARVLGGGGFLIVLLLDAGKAVLALALARWLLPDDPWSAVALPAVVAGHIWPAPLRFRGGRGAGPFLGGCLMLNPLFAAAAAIPAAIAATFTRRSLYITTSAAMGGIVCAWWLLPGAPARVAFGVALLFVVLAHRTHFMRALHRPAP
ncbi:MAG TPA: glycerol-3-phosphate acyltransferase [Opitutaceae bacterium]|nr:glycerol-3-phosphate acyltransferase [Opitutaceae bacterium]